MLLKFFKSNLPYVVVFIPILGAILWIPSLLPFVTSKQVVANQFTSPVYDLAGNILNKNYYLKIGSALLFCILQSYYLIRMNFKHIFIENKTYLPAMIYVLICSALFSNQNLQPALLANFFVLFAFDKALLIDKGSHHFKRFYESGIFIGIATLIYPWAIYLLAAIWLCLIILRNFEWREMLSSIIGVATPIALLFTISYLKNNFVLTYTTYINLLFSKQQNQFLLQSQNIVSLVIFALLIMITIFFSLQIMGTKKISSRKYITLFLWLLLVAYFIYFLNPAVGNEIVYIMAIPLSLTFTFLFTELRKKIFAEILFTILLIAVFVIIWF